jgi:hypothetical protein
MQLALWLVKGKKVLALSSDYYHVNVGVMEGGMMIYAATGIYA